MRNLRKTFAEVRSSLTEFQRRPYPSVSPNQDPGAEGNLRRMTGQEFQGDEVAMDDRSMSGAHPMYKRPKVVEGPYAAVKTRIGQKVSEDNTFGGEERTRRAEYEGLKVRLESVYRQKVE